MSAGFAIIVVLTGVLYALLFWFNRRFEQDAALGRRFEATIIEKGKHPFGGQYFLRYRYMDNGNSKQGEQCFSHADGMWEKHSKDQAVVLVACPSISRSGLLIADTFESQRASLRKALRYYPLFALIVLSIAYGSA